MVAFLRQFLVVLLVLLQFAAPLVHAHVDDSGQARGLHLHEFENLANKSTATLVTALDSVNAAQSAIVELGAVIKNQQPLDDVSPVYCLQGESLQWLAQYLVEAINFSPQPGLVVFEPFLSQNLTRAPPPA